MGNKIFNKVMDVVYRRGVCVVWIFVYVFIFFIRIWLSLVLYKFFFYSNGDVYV